MALTKCIVFSFVLTICSAEIINRYHVSDIKLFHKPFVWFEKPQPTQKSLLVTYITIYLVHINCFLSVQRVAQISKFSNYVLHI